MSQLKNRIAHFRALFASDKLIEMESNELLLNASRFDKIEQDYALAYTEELIGKKIAVLGSITTHYIIKVLKLFLYKYGISPQFYEGEYDSIAMELLDKESGVYRFSPDVMLIFTYHTDIKKYPQLFSTPQEVREWVEDRTSYYERLWEATAAIKGCQVFQTLFVPPVERQLGNLEVNYHFSRTNCLRILNSDLIRKRTSNVLLVDTEYIASYVGKKNWFDHVGYFTSKQGISLEILGYFCHNIARILAAHVGKTKKCLVLDLDNTLWGGVVGDDGIEGININPNNALGESFLAFQKHVKLLKDRGVILAVCSKNNEEVAKSPFLNHPDMHLKLEDIPCFVANWDDKATNIKLIASKLNIGLDSLVFFDDNPAEREIVRRYLPEVEVIEVPEDPAHYVYALEKSGAFEWTLLSHEDLQRSDTYVNDVKRGELRECFIDYNEYLESLEMTATIGHITKMEQERFTQLINKSNQFNLRTKRYSEAAIEQIRLLTNEYALFFVSFADKFSNYGIISSVILKKVDTTLFIETLVMSCRVLKRGVEYALYNTILDTAKKLGCEWIVGEYLPTKKNGMVADFFPSLGFEACSPQWFPTEEEGGLLFHLRVAMASPKQHFITINNPVGRVNA